MIEVPVTIALPTFGREKVLTDTIGQLLQQTPRPAEILVLDQTPTHDAETTQFLDKHHSTGAIRWLRFGPPSQPAALNRGLRESKQPFVLFLDDDIRIDQGFVEEHFEAFGDENIWAVAGQVLQPGEDEDIDYVHDSTGGTFSDFDFCFRSARRCFVENGMSGNLCVRREKAIQVGGFDENFMPPVSYRFDNEFCKRLCRAGGKILFEPKARIYHLRAERGGTRSVGSHMKSISPIHGVGDYYFAFRQPISFASIAYVFRRPFREVRTKFHLAHPWYIPVKVVGEIRAIFLAVLMVFKGPKLFDSANRE